MGAGPYFRLRRRTPASQQLSIHGDDTDQCVQLDDVHGVVGVHVNVARAGKIGPLLNECPVRGEYLYPVVLAVGHEYASIGVHPHTMGNVKLSGSGLAGFPPGEQQLPAGREFVDSGISVPIGDVQVAVRVKGDVAGPVERPGGPHRGFVIVARPARVRWLVSHPQGHQQVAFPGVFQHNVVVLHRQIQVVIRVDEHAVGVGQHALAPGVQVIAIPVQDDQGMIAPVK